MPPKVRPAARKSTANTKNPQSTKIGNVTRSTPETSSGLSQEAEDQFELELCWCVQQLEMCLATGKLSEKQAQDLSKNISVLKSSTAPLIKKRQVMRNTLGNYREKMALDEQKLGKNSSSIKFTTTPAQSKKCTFLKTAACTSMKEKHLSDDVTLIANASDKSDIDNVQHVFKFNFQIKE